MEPITFSLTHPDSCHQDRVGLRSHTLAAALSGRSCRSVSWWSDPDRKLPEQWDTTRPAAHTQRQPISWLLHWTDITYSAPDGELRTFRTQIPPFTPQQPAATQSRYKHNILIFNVKDMKNDHIESNREGMRRRPSLSLKWYWYCYWYFLNNTQPELLLMIIFD